MPLTLPDEKPAEVGPGGVAITLAATLAGVIAANFVLVWLCSLSSVNLGTHIVRHKWKLLESLESPVEWLILGDSGGTQGLDPEVFDACLGTSCVNLCTIGGTLAVGDAWMLDDYLKRFGPPRNILLVHSLEVWERVPGLPEVGQIPRRWGFWKRMLPRLDLTLRQQLKLAIHRYVPLYAAHHTAGQIIRHPAAAFSGSGIFSRRGFVPRRHHSPELIQLDVEDQLRTVGGRPFKFSQVNLAALERMSELAERHQFNVFVAVDPLYEGLYRFPAFQAYLQSFEQAMRGLTSNHPRLHLLPAPPMVFPLERMSDSVDHVLPEGARDYTTRVAELIRKATLSGLLSER